MVTTGISCSSSISMQHPTTKVRCICSAFCLFFALFTRLGHQLTEHHGGLCIWRLSRWANAATQYEGHTMAAHLIIHRAAESILRHGMRNENRVTVAPALMRPCYSANKQLYHPVGFVLAASIAAVGTSSDACLTRSVDRKYIAGRYS